MAISIVKLLLVRFQFTVLLVTVQAACAWRELEAKILE